MQLKTLAQAQSQQAILHRLEAFSPRAERLWGRMTAGGAVCHLALSFEMVLGEETCSTRTGFLQRTLFKFGALRVPIPWPPGYPTLPELIEGAPKMQPGDFGQDHARLLAAYRRFVSETIPLAPAHPIFGPMTHWEWMRWGYLHADHHLRQFGL